MYLQLFHGRQNPHEQLEDWGAPGPVFGPLEYVHTTYGVDVKFTYADNSKRNGWLTVVDGLVYYDGFYYGDWSTSPALDQLEDRLAEFDQTKASPPLTEPTIDRDHLANLLTAINGFAHLAQDHAVDEEKRRHYLELLVEISSRATELYHQFFLLRLHGGIEPELIGPFDTEDQRDQQAIALRKENDEDVILAVDGPGESVRIEAYGHGFLNPE